MTAETRPRGRVYFKGGQKSLGAAGLEGGGLSPSAEEEGSWPISCFSPEAIWLRPNLPLHA